MKSKWFVIVVLVVLALSLAACATPNPMRGVALEGTGEVYGFWNGLWDGATAYWSFIMTLFGLGDYGIYEVHNNGVFYDLGFLLGFGAIVGSSTSLSLRSR